MAIKVSADLRRIRRSNLQSLIDTRYRGVVLTLAKECEMPSTNLHRILGDHLAMGNKIAKRIEQNCKPVSQSASKPY